MGLTENQELEYLELLDLEVQERARRDLLAFTLYTKPDYRVNWHHRSLCRKLNAFIHGDIRFLMVFMPPRHGKSELVSRRLPAMLHGIYPNSEIFAASYLDNLAGDMTKDVQTIIDSSSYRKLFPNTRIPLPGRSYVQGTRSMSEHTILGQERGKYRGQGVGGSFTGKGMNFGIIDDPIKGREIADSEAFRERLWEFFKNDFVSRMETDLDTGRLGQILVTLTRWHEDDLAGRLLEEQRDKPGAINWDIVSYPALRVDLDDASDPRQIGEALWPAKYSEQELEKFKIDERAWSSLYQQNPHPIGGSLFKESMFRYGPMPAEFDYSFIMADTAYKDKQENDFTVFTHFGVKNNMPYVNDVWREQVKAADIEVPAANFIKRHQGYGFRLAWIEPKGHGIYLNQMLPRAPHGCMLPSDSMLSEFFNDRTKDKVERANNAIPWLVGRYITINENLPGKEDLKAECLSFPRGKHDDFVDTVVDGIKKIYGRPISILDVS